MLGIGCRKSLVFRLSLAVVLIINGSFLGSAVPQPTWKITFTPNDLSQSVTIFLCEENEEDTDGEQEGSHDVAQPGDEFQRQDIFCFSGKANKYYLSYTPSHRQRFLLHCCLLI